MADSAELLQINNVASPSAFVADDWYLATAARSADDARLSWLSRPR
jgi:hypothetical protein